MLKGRTVLIVETEALIAIDIQSTLESAGAAETIIAFSATEALKLAEHWAGAALAVVEVEQNRHDLLALIRTVVQSGIPTVCISADSRLTAGLPGLPNVRVLAKPVPEETLLEAARQAQLPSR
ncbi:hypothetical protein IC608_14545 [Devosia sp. PTR5]|uniref:Response regulatory domain-containing protein n=1 Tax=Devosia oryzisoli TaxID=2774138 RepID=A0A927IRG7_9HYPH|nr:hypothetical protein [Devosia oryzisoli]MBD8066690.1 hypothetical protein [Devosia oryzisoli]